MFIFLGGYMVPVPGRLSSDPYSQGRNPPQVNSIISLRVFWQSFVINFCCLSAG